MLLNILQAMLLILVTAALACGTFVKYLEVMKSSFFSYDELKAASTLSLTSILIGSVAFLLSLA